MKHSGPKLLNSKDALLELDFKMQGDIFMRHGV